MSTSPSFEKLCDQALLQQFGDLVQQDQHHTAGLLRHIEAIDRRQLWAKQGHPSMFDLCVSRYHMSESTAGKRIGAARTARQFPILFEMVARGEIHLSGIHRLKAHLTRDNHEQVLAQAKHKTIKQIEELVARLAPRPDVRSTLRKLPQPRPSVSATPLVAAPPPPVATPAMLPVPRRSPDPTPLAPGRYKLQVTLGQAANDQLKQLQDLLAHQIPNSDPAPIIERAIDALLAQVLKQKTGPPTSRAPPASLVSPARRGRSPPRSAEKYGHGTKLAAPSSAKTATAATRRAGSSMLTSSHGPRGANTARPMWHSGASRTMLSKLSAILELVTWLASEGVPDLTNHQMTERAGADRPSDRQSLGPRRPAHDIHAVAASALASSSLEPALVFQDLELLPEQQVEVLGVVVLRVEVPQAA